MGGRAVASPHATTPITNLGQDARPQAGGSSQFTVSAIADGGGPYGIAYDPSLDLMTVANDNNYTVSLYNATSVSKSSEPSVERPRQLAVNPEANLAYVADFNGYVQVLNLSRATVTKSVWVAGAADGVAYAPSVHAIYVAVYYDSNLTVVSVTPHEWA
jgi:DNA-binding beta-propeller fold protein YncE